MRGIRFQWPDGVVPMAARTAPAVRTPETAAWLNPPPEPASAGADEVRVRVEHVVARVLGEYRLGGEADVKVDDASPVVRVTIGLSTTLPARVIDLLHDEVHSVLVLPGRHWSHAPVEIRTHPLRPRRPGGRGGEDVDEPSLWWG